MRPIDGDALFERAYKVWGTEADDDETNIFMQMINDAPTIDPVKHGRWDYYCGTDIIESHFQCSVCKSLRYEHYAVNAFKFCPNCGARMDANE